MTDPRTIRIEEFDYPLPEDRIAHFPLPERDASQLLIWDQTLKTVSSYRQITDHLPEQALMVFNDTKVVQARMFFFNENGGRIELFCLEPAGTIKEMAVALQSKGEVIWKCFVGGVKKWKGQTLSGRIEVGGKSLVISAENLGAEEDAYRIRFFWTPAEMSFAEVLEEAGKIPLPPYIKREAEASDLQRYQTVYARREGSVAAPTAGLHFTEYILQSFQKKNIKTGYVTLHVGAGTFKPVKSEAIGEHLMHSEQLSVSLDFLKQLQLQLQSGAPVIPVGTTAMRTLESLYWFGVKLSHQENKVEWPELEQWYPYQSHSVLPAAHEAITALIHCLEDHHKTVFTASTSIMIVPGYDMRIVDALVTNFHQPKSTLLLLVSALIGDDWKKAYDYALQHNFRFLSYGDGSLLFKKR